MPPRSKRKRSSDGKQTPKEKKVQIQQPRSLTEACVLVIGNLRMNTLATPFNQPVTDLEAPQYSEIVSNPMDLGTIFERAKQGNYLTPAELRYDVDCIWYSCDEYNGPDTPLSKNVAALKKIFAKLDKEYLECWDNGKTPQYKHNISSDAMDQEGSEDIIKTSPENKKFKLVFKGGKVSNVG
eukprot:CAMPEP_0114408628 /NCGR_PEP_ID=MMETSP0102-20121206/22859_1 /TAXON_ID=38822 ORGANISM="Pteridomonas danica, Strain PT" /NCGR_SAMPLE_ID=MMETSP0102 /ASSEMBLY_ACC=CAM_ASM_000212 /LENGTH=181 /DNA_ID=CAMNT_0001575739 /DNA_START=55 /DNA_END=596 /DNA_ORIENTATION=+